MYRFVPSLDDYGIIKEEGEKAFNVSIDENRFIRLQEERVYLVYRGEAVKTDTMYMRKERERAKERERERERGREATDLIIVMEMRGMVRRSACYRSLES